MSSIQMEIRIAEAADLARLRQIEQEIIRYERPFDPNLKEDPITYYDLPDLIRREDAQVIVATVDGEIIGTGYALIKNEKPYKKPEKYVYLGFMYVSPEYRGKGINGLIMDELIGWARERGLNALQLDVYAENVHAIQAYGKKGFEPDLLKMRLGI